MRRSKIGTVIACLALLSGCGGGGSGSTGATASQTPSTSQTSASCSLRNRQDFALATLREWYLFPETLPASLDPTPYATVSDYIDALTATARSQGRDRYFTYLTSIASENAYYNSGASAGFGIRLSTDAPAGRLYVAEAFENTPALAAGLDRGTEILAIGDDANTLRNVSDILATQGSQGVTDAIGPSTAGLTRALRISNAAGTRVVSVTKASYSLDPVSQRYGARIISDGGRQIGYLNLRTFIDTADDELRAAFAQFRAAGITQFVVDLRYNGGGLIDTAELMGDLLGGNRATTDVLTYTNYRPEKANQNMTRRFVQRPQSVSPVRVAFIGTGGTASASELVINSFVPYLGSNMALVGANTYGKPVGQVAIDKSACDDRIRVVAFSNQNAARSDAYYGGLAGAVPVTCKAADDLQHAFGDPAETSLRQALNYLGGQSCTPISGAQTAQAVGAARPLQLLTPANPTAAQRDVPGLF